MAEQNFTVLIVNYWYVIHTFLDTCVLWASLHYLPVSRNFLNLQTLDSQGPTEMIWEHVAQLSSSDMPGMWDVQVVFKDASRSASRSPIIWPDLHFSHDMIHVHFGHIMNEGPQQSQQPAFEAFLEKTMSTTSVNASYGPYLLLSYTTLQLHSFLLLYIRFSSLAFAFQPLFILLYSNHP